MRTWCEIRNTEGILCAQLLPGAAIFFQQPVSKALATAREIIDASYGNSYFVMPPGGGYVVAGQMKIFPVTGGHAFNKNLRRLAFPLRDVWVEPYNNIRETNNQSFVCTVIKKLCSNRNRLVWKAIILTKTGDR